MTKLAYLSSTALCALALVAGVAPAAADNELFGTAHFGYDWTNYNPSSGIPDYDSTTFIGQGAIGVPLGNGWSGQLNFSFESQDFDFNLPTNFSLDTWQVGGVIAYQADGQWKGGIDLAYETEDLGISIDGVRAGLRGEYYWMPNFTVRASAGWQDYDTNGFKADGFYGGLGASYYFTRNIGLRASADYYTYDVKFAGLSFGDYSAWDFGGKLQYKCDDYPLVFGGHVNYATTDAFGNDGNAWNFGVDITAVFGVGSANSSLRDTEVNAPFEAQRLGIKYFNF